MIHRSGGRYWRYDYRFRHKRKTIALSAYPRISLREARVIHESMQRELYNDIDPAATRKAAKLEARGTPTFKEAAEEWMKRQASDWTVKHRTVRSRLQRYAYAILGDIACDAITPLDILRVCRQAEQRGHLEVALKATSILWSSHALCGS